MAEKDMHMDFEEAMDEGDESQMMPSYSTFPERLASPEISPEEDRFNIPTFSEALQSNDCFPDFSDEQNLPHCSEVLCESELGFQPHSSEVCKDQFPITLDDKTYLEGLSDGISFLASDFPIRSSSPNPMPTEFQTDCFEKSDEDEATHEEDQFCFTDNPLIYANAPLTIYDSLVSILTVALTFQWTGACIQAVLELISLHCAKQGNIFRKSLYHFKNYFSHIKGNLQTVSYCSTCMAKCSTAPCAHCKSNSKLCYLIKIPILSQLEAMFKRSDFLDKLENLSRRPKSGDLCDVYDAKIYREKVEKGILGKFPNISFMWYTDGASLYSSSSRMSVWPLYLSISELKFTHRFRKENLVVPLLWVGPVKPSGNLLLKEIYPELLALSKGVSMDINGLGMQTVRAHILCGTGDTPARSLMLNMVQFNGEFACQSCEQKGQSHPLYAGVRLFPYRPSEMIPRTEKNMVQYGKIGKPEKGKAHMGCKGPTMLSKCDDMFVESMAIDPMHSLYSGVSKRIVKLQIKSSYSSKPWSVSKHVALLNDRLTKIKPPLFFPRLPRSLDDYAYWKASEEKAWLMYYSIPVLSDVLPDNYLKHHVTLVTAIQLLNADRVSKTSLEKSKLLLHKYVSLFEDLYDLTFMSMNVHLLLHLPSVVENLGPLWVYSCFPLEGINGAILSLVHGTRWAEKQIASSVQMTLKLQELVSDIKSPESKEFCETLMNPSRKGKRSVYGSCEVLGSLTKLEKVPAHVESLLSRKGMALQVQMFERLKKNKYIFVVESNKQMSRDSSCITYLNGSSVDIAILKMLLIIKICKCKSECKCECNLFAVIQKVIPVQSFETFVEGICAPHIKRYEICEEFDLVSSKKLLAICVKMTIGNNLFIAVPSNTHEVE